MADGIEVQVGVAKADAFAQATTGEVETAKVLLADGGDGKEKEVTLRSTHAGASSEAPANSGIPSAEKQHGVEGEAFDKQTDHTPMPDHVLPRKQNLEP